MNRREFLKVMGAGAGATAFAGSPLTGVFGQNLAAALDAADATAPTAVDPISRAVNRLTYGPTPGLVNSVKQIGLPAFIEQQLAPEKIDDSAADALVGNFSTLAMTIPELAGQGEAKGGGGNVELELIQATTLRAIYSQRQLQEIMTNFWSEHFNIWSRKDTITRTLKTADDRDVIRKFALGKFRDLVGASATSPAMLDYLDNDRSDKNHPNENYGRELLELHTLGVNGGYTENDVQAAARAFTGWTLLPLRTHQPGAPAVKKGTPTPTPSPTPSATPIPDSTAWEFTFNAKIHDTNAKTFMTMAIPAGGGIDDGQKILDYIAVHPSTALHIATKLCVRFIGDTPSDRAITAVQQSFLQSGGDIKTVLRTLFALPDFTDAGPKYKRPWEFVVSSMRALNAKVDPTKVGAVLAVLQALGHVPFDHDMANGYSDYAKDWQGNMLARWNLSFNTLYGKMPGVKVDLNSIVQSQNVPIEVNAVVNFFAQHFYGRALTTSESTAFNTYLNQGGAPDLTTAAGQQKINDVLGLMMNGPAFQYR